MALRVVGELTGTDLGSTTTSVGCQQYRAAVCQKLPILCTPQTTQFLKQLHRFDQNQKNLTNDVSCISLVKFL